MNCSSVSNAAAGSCWLSPPLSIRKASRGLLMCVLASSVSAYPALAQDQQALCDRGDGHFTAQLKEGAGVTVGPVAEGGFASRACKASLTWKGEPVLEVATAGQIDLDIMGADLGFGSGGGLSDSQSCGRLARDVFDLLAGA